MLLEKINAWLTSPDDYQIGLELLRKTGYKGFTLTILAKGENAYNRDRLADELRKWAESQNIVNPNGTRSGTKTKENSDALTFGLDYTVPGATVVVMPNILPKPADVSDYQAPADEPAELQALNQQIYALMDERSEAKAWLRAKKDLGNSEEACAIRLPFAIRVKQITRQIDELYSRIDFFDEYGYFPPAATDPAEIIDDTKLLLNMRSYVSRYKGWLKKKKLTADQRQSYQQLLQHYSDEKARLELKLSKSIIRDEK